MGKYDSDDDRRRSRRGRDRKSRRSRSKSRSRSPVARDKKHGRRSRQNSTSRTRSKERRRRSRDRHRGETKGRRETRHRSSSKSRRDSSRSRSRSRGASRRSRSTSINRERKRKKDKNEKGSKSKEASSKSKASVKGGDSHDGEKIKNSKPCIPGADILAKIESDSFVPEIFVSLKSKKGESEGSVSQQNQNHEDAIFGVGNREPLKTNISSKANAIPRERQIEGSGIMASLLHEREENKNDRWIKKLNSMRQKKLQR